MPTKTVPPRSWDVDLLLVLGKREGDKAKHLRAVPVLILERWVLGGREEGVANHVWTKDIARRLVDSGLVRPFRPKGTSVLLAALTRIQASRNLTRPPLIEYREEGQFWVNLPHYEPLLQEYRRKYRELSEEDYRKLYANGEPAWESINSPVPKTTLLQPVPPRLLQVLQEYEAAWEEQLRRERARANIAEQENRELSEQLRHSNSVLAGIADDGLRKRISGLLNSPLDTMIREAGVVLEDRLRATGKAGSDLVGVKLVDTLLSPDKKRLVFSSHTGEQEGVQMLYRGAMQFIRNPPMHKLIEYRETTARLLIRLVDSLLQLLSEAELQKSD
jgi:hypothetical protein